MTDDIYPRVIEIHRVGTNAGVADDVIGLADYSGAEATTDVSNLADEIVLFTGVPASIQVLQSGRKKDSALPQDIVFAPSWRIMIPLSGPPVGAIRDRDIIIDDEHYRYEVAQNYWNILGWKLVCIRLEA